jgi:hypothetical protein
MSRPSKPDPAKSLKRKFRSAMDILRLIESSPYSESYIIPSEFFLAGYDPAADSKATDPVPVSTDPFSPEKALALLREGVLAAAPVKLRAGPFSPEKVVALLHDRVLNENARLPRPADPAIAHLANALNAIWSDVQSAPAWREKQEKLQKIEDAIRVLTEILPEHRGDYASARYGVSAADARDDLAAFDALATAARAAHERGLPRAKTVFIETAPTEKWKHFAEYLMAIFQFFLPKQPKTAAYRFIVAVTPDITGEHTTYFTVETTFKKKSFVNRGNSAA